MTGLEELETFAKNLTARASWPKEVGRIDTDQAQATVSAMIVEDPARTPHQMRGAHGQPDERESKGSGLCGRGILGTNSLRRSAKFQSGRGPWLLLLPSSLWNPAWIRTHFHGLGAHGLGGIGRF